MDPKSFKISDGKGEGEETISIDNSSVPEALQAIKWDKKGKLEILDQTLLPEITQYVQINNVEDGWNAINKMQVRGAPAIAIVGCLSLAVELIHLKYETKEALYQDVEKKLNYLVSARPTAVNLKKAADTFIKLANDLCNNHHDLSLSYMTYRIITDIETMLEEDLETNILIGNYGTTELLFSNRNKDFIRILTHCNTGSLATAGFGTALGVIRALHRTGKLDHVYFTETRPYNQGARLTAYELVHDQIPATLICDNMVAAVMKTKQITAVVVGADRVALNGDTANKIGTYQIAILAKYHNIPFYVAAPRTSIDVNIYNGNDIIIEERLEEEITYINGKRIAAEGIKCWNPSFDVTPGSLITGIITEIGTFKPAELSKKI